MRLLLDNNLPPRLVDLLQGAGHECSHVRDHGLHAAPDDEVMRHAPVHGQVLVSADTDFGTLLARSGAVRRSIVLTRRSGGRRTTDLAPLLIVNLESVTDDLEAGAVVVISDTDLRIRSLSTPPEHRISHEPGVMGHPPLG